MEALKPLQGICSVGLVICVGYLTATTETSLVLERPAAASVFTLFALSAVFLLFERLSKLWARSSPLALPYDAIPLEDFHDGETDVVSTISAKVQTRKAAIWSAAKIWLRIGFLGLLLVFRFQILPYATQGSKCTKKGLDGLYAVLPVLVAAADWRRNQWSLNQCKGIARAATVVILSTIVGFTAIYRAPLPSTYICSPQSSPSTVIPTLQISSILFDCLAVLYLLPTLDSSIQTATRDRKEVLNSLGLACTIAATICLIVAISQHFLQVRDTPSPLVYLPENFVARILKLTVLLSVTAAFALHTIDQNGALITSLLILCSITCTAIILGDRDITTTSDDPKMKILLSLGLFVGSTLQSKGDFSEDPITATNHKSSFPRKRWSVFYFFAVLAIVSLVQGIFKKDEGVLLSHPVDGLMTKARATHDEWLETASSGTSLAEVTANYVSRYNNDPPPHFDQWYEYAIKRSSVIIDEFDGIHDDLLPFWSLKPAEIRQRTKEALASGQGIGGVTIRNGTVAVTDGTPGTHRWMMDGIVEMTNKFASALPDMDLAFNLNDECRVSVPYKEWDRVVNSAKAEIGRRRGPSRAAAFSAYHEEDWRAAPEEQGDMRRFQELSFSPTWNSFGSVHCPPDSPARRRKYWALQELCASCLSPHSSSLFMSNWSLAADVCNQPDIANAHGFYISPSSFAPTHDLMPIFSQSKAPGFNDIRHPSAWNYMDKARYDPNEAFPDPDFDEKARTLFWRGASSEGYAVEGQSAWNGMARQRMVHLLTNSASPQPLLLPDDDDDAAPPRLRTALVDASTLRASISTDVRFTHFARCHAPECDAQEALFGVGARADFQAHWGHRYLLDADGAGFSGRFVPFLLSRSLPFKLALFREWWDSRLTPWLHFVPLDLRGHGVWATLAYFAGFEGVVAGRRVGWAPRDAEARVIAEEGAEWARKVLRKEDMEIYMFRLLLEWGRLIDDKRLEIGFSV